MNPLARIRIEKAAADCGFDLTPYDDEEEKIVLCSSAFPESVSIEMAAEKGFFIAASPLLLGEKHASAVGIAAPDIQALYAVLSKLAATARNLPNRIAQQFMLQTKNLPQTTEVERLVVQRIGQNLFRRSLLDYWGGKCCVTGLAVPELLRASHIRPWAKCDTNEQRLDVFNGLLLCPNMDALFDGGWITFSDTGEMLISDALPNEARMHLGLNTDLSIQGIRPEISAYLIFHRKQVFRSF